MSPIDMEVTPLVPPEVLHFLPKFGKFFQKLTLRRYWAPTGAACAAISSEGAKLRANRVQLYSSGGLSAWYRRTLISIYSIVAVVQTWQNWKNFRVLFCTSGNLNEKSQVFCLRLMSPGTLYPSAEFLIFPPNRLRDIKKRKKFFFLLFFVWKPSTGPALDQPLIHGWPLDQNFQVT